ncbi:MAG TPA: thioredoxin family protein [Candidatus Xenobia bacterium]|jgi:thioredoxin 1
MTFVSTYSADAPTRPDLDAMPGPVLVEFGTDWCPICQALQPDLQALLAGRPDIRHLKIEDGRGRPLGRSFQVRLWPNLIFMQDGRVVRQLARPRREEVEAAIAALQ